MTPAARIATLLLTCCGKGDNVSKLTIFHRDGTTSEVEPPKQGTPTICVGCDKALSETETYGDLCSPMCWDCHSSLFDKAQAIW